MPLPLQAVCPIARGSPCSLLRAAALLPLPGQTRHDSLHWQGHSTSALPQLLYRAHAAHKSADPYAAAQLAALLSQPWAPSPADYALSRFNESLSLVLLDASDYDAIYIADGHGLMWDGPYNSEIKRLVEEAWVSTSLTVHPGSCVKGVAGRTCMTALKANPLTAAWEAWAYECVPAFHLWLPGWGGLFVLPLCISSSCSACRAITTSSWSCVPQGYNTIVATERQQAGGGCWAWVGSAGQRSGPADMQAAGAGPGGALWLAVAVLLC